MFNMLNRNARFSQFRATRHLDIDRSNRSWGWLIDFSPTNAPSNTFADGNRPHPYSRKTIALMATHITLLITLIFAFRYLPLQDYPEWVYHGVAMKHIVLGELLQSAYAVHPYLPPNAASTLLIGAFAVALPAEISGKLFLLIMVITLYTGVIRFMRLTVSGRDNLLAWISLCIVFNNAFWHGNLSYYLGLGVALHGGHLLLKRGWADSNAKTALLITCAYLCHFFAWFLVLTIACAGLLFIPDRKRLRAMLLGTLPSLLLFLHYTCSRSTDVASTNMGYSFSETLIQKARMIAGAIHPFQRFRGIAEPGTWVTALDYSVVGAFALLALLAAWHMFRVKRFGFNGALALPLPFLILVLPLFSQGVVYPGQRLVPFLVINIVACVCLAYDRLRRQLTAFFAVVGVATFVYAAYFTIRFDSAVRHGDGPTWESYFAMARPSGTDGFLRLEFYDAMAQGTPMPIFDTGMIRRR